MQSGDARKRIGAARKDYVVTVRTGSKLGAGTDSNIYVTIYGSKGNTEAHRLNGLISGNAFERNKTDRVVLRGLPDVGALRSIVVRSDGKYAKAGWYVDWVNVNEKTARFSRWLEKDKLRASGSLR